MGPVPTPESWKEAVLGVGIALILAVILLIIAHWIERRNK